MKATLTSRGKCRLALIMVFLLLIPTCSKKENPEISNNDIWDIDKDGIPKFANTNYIELSKIYRITKFRSSFGHDYSDAFESCRSMKHYFEPKSEIDWTTVKIFSPVTGVITRVEQEWAGTKLEIASADYPAFRISIFHINPQGSRNINDTIPEGTLLGTHIGSMTDSDISVIVNDPTRRGRMVSWFDVITDDVFNEYVAHGVSSRSDMIILKSLRDANPLTCSGDVFTNTDPLESWINLN
jgi:hypothetical protein